MRRSFRGVCPARSSLFIHAHCSETSSAFPLRSSHQSEQEAFCPGSLGPHFHLLIGCHPQVAARPLTCHLRNSWCCHSSGPGLLKRREKKKKKFQPHSLRLWGERRRPQCLITPSHDSTHQDSSSNKSISL